MKHLPQHFLALVILLGLPLRAVSAIHYVDGNSTNATPPYTNWTTAATNIQDAVSVAVAGDEVVVTNGAYQPVEVDKPLSLRSVNGPQSSIHPLPFSDPTPATLSRRFYRAEAQ